MAPHDHPGCRLVAALKAAAGAAGPGLCLPVGRPVECLLRPVATRPDRLYAPDVAALTAWRNRHVTAFLSEFQATEARTAGWLVNVVGPKDGKVLFMADDPAGRTFGYMGLDYIDWARGYGEADAVVRGADAPPGVMGRALTALMTWAETALGLTRLDVRVRSDNPAVGFYRHLGFDEYQRVPLTRAGGAGMVQYVEDPRGGGEPSLVYMTWKGKSPS